MAYMLRRGLVLIFIFSLLNIVLYMIFVRYRPLTTEQGILCVTSIDGTGTQKCPVTDRFVYTGSNGVSNNSAAVSAKDIVGKPLVDVIRRIKTPQNSNGESMNTLADDPWGYVRFGTSESLNFHCSECAVVSSSSRLLHQGAGPIIDATPCVIRMNNHPTKNFTQDVGEKTTVRVMSHIATPVVYAQRESLLKGASKPDIIIMWGNPPSFEKKNNAVNRNLNDLQELFPDLKVSTLNRAQYNFAETVFRRETGFDRIETKTWLSTGWFTMIFALKACDKVTVYGITDPEYCNKHHGEKDLPYHYYEAKVGDECYIFNKSEIHKQDSHRFLTEKYVFNRWRTMYNLSFQVPSWDSVESIANSSSNKTSVS